MVGLVVLFDPSVLSDPGGFGGDASLGDLAFAFPLAIVAFTALDASSGFAGQIAVGRKGLKRLLTVRSGDYRSSPTSGWRSSLRRTLGAANGPAARPDAPLLGVVGGHRAGRAARRAALRRRPVRGARPLHRVRGGHARPVAARLLAGGQPPDPVARRPPAPDLPDADRDHRRGRAHRCRARRHRGPRPARLGVRLRGGARLCDRAPVGDRAAPEGARSRPPVPHAASTSPGCPAPAVLGAVVSRSWRWPACSPSTMPRASSGPSGWLSG